MRVNAFVMLAAVAASSYACNNNSAPLAPAQTVSASPTLSTPTPQSPVGGQTIASLSATLTASAATSDVASYVPQYRFQLFNAANALVQDSGLVTAPSWTTTATLTPNSQHTWKVRAESQGFFGAWSGAATFMTPDPPPAYRGTIGNWQACAGRVATDLVTCVWDTIHPADSVGDLEVSKRVAWLLRGDGAGLLIKNSGDNVVIWQGYSFSASRICFADGHIFKIIGDAGPGGANTPGFSDNGFVDLSLYVPAIDPSKP